MEPVKETKQTKKYVITQNSTKGNFGSVSQGSSEKSVMPQTCLDWSEGEEAVTVLHLLFIVKGFPLGEAF